MAQFALTSGQIDDLKHLLLERERQLTATLNAELHIDGPAHASITAESDADWTTADVDADTLIASAERHSTALADTNAALEKAQPGAREGQGEVARRRGRQRLIEGTRAKARGHAAKYVPPAPRVSAAQTPSRAFC